MALATLMMLPAGRHQLGRVLGAQEIAADVDVEVRVDELGGHVREEGPLHDGGVVDEDVELAERLDRRREEAGDVARLADIGLRRDGRPAGLRDGRDDLVRLLLALAVVDDDLRPLGGEPRGDGRADPARRTGDEGDLPGQTLVGHDCSLTAGVDGRNFAETAYCPGRASARSVSTSP